MPKLTEIEEFMNEEQLIYKWLQEGRIHCESIIKLYADTIRKERDEAINEATSYTYPLYLMQEKAKLPQKQEWIRDKTIGMLYAFNNQRNGINFKKHFNQYVIDHKLNTDTDSIRYEIYNKDYYKEE